MRKEPLSRERVLAAAVTIADADGLAAVTMRRLGADLGVEAMSLYHHLRGKDALLDGVAETLVAEILDAVGRVEAGDWRSRLRGRFLAAREVMLRHPWGPGLLGSRGSVPFGVYLYYDAILGTLVEGGFTYRLAHRALHAFGSMPLGFVQEMFSTSAGDGADEDLSAVADVLPHLTAMVASETHETELGWCDSRVEFEFTLDLLLDGLERLRG
ncbi:TetR/AcrR family transcriptional regulator C-terminal domain-containing protein [Actinoplanes sp. NPDC049802]|uniref:TetR/AcrR family transcriptional regulator C-terminal domain-containing protein n=1 Tax=Actinoplanes sp. NPDC049802 TaxID=3154742 RepID=UPI0034024097